MFFFRESDITLCSARKDTRMKFVVTHMKPPAQCAISWDEFLPNYLMVNVDIWLINSPGFDVSKSTFSRTRKHNFWTVSLATRFSTHFRIQGVDLTVTHVTNAQTIKHLYGSKWRELYHHKTILVEPKLLPQTGNGTNDCTGNVQESSDDFTQSQPESLLSP